MTAPLSSILNLAIAGAVAMQPGITTEDIATIVRTPVDELGDHLLSLRHRWIITRTPYNNTGRRDKYIFGPEVCPARQYSLRLARANRAEPETLAQSIGIVDDSSVERDVIEVAGMFGLDSVRIKVVDKLGPWLSIAELAYAIDQPECFVARAVTSLVTKGKLVSRLLRSERDEIWDTPRYVHAQAVGR